MLPTYRRAALLTGASVTVLAFAVPVHAKGAPAPTAAATAGGIHQEADGPIAINLFDLEATDPALEFITIDQIKDPGNQAVANAEILCGEFSTSCTQPGAVEQIASGTDLARNELIIGGDLAIEAVATATGATATAIGRIQTGILQQAVSGGEAANSLDVSGSIDIQASANAVATAGSAGVLAAITQAMVLSASGATSASIGVANSGSISIGVSANGSAQGSGSESAFVGAVTFGIDAVALATGEGPASIEVSNGGDIGLNAEAHANAPGLALATAAALSGLNAFAVASDGDASIAVDNSGAISLSAEAQATGGQTGFAVANANAGLFDIALGFGEGDASAEIANSGSLTLDAEARAQATGNAIAIALAGTAIFNIANAATGDALASIENSGSIEVMADATATGLFAQATVLAGGGLLGGAVFQSAFAASGDAIASLANSGDIVLGGHAEANGSDFATAIVFGGPGVGQFAVADGGGSASASLSNTGSILLESGAEAVAAGTANAISTLTRGVTTLGIADIVGLGGDASADLINEGEIGIAVNAHAMADSAFALASVFGGLGVTAAAFGNGGADASLVNSGTVEIGANATATGGVALAVATASNVIANAGDARDGEGQAELVNEGTFEINAGASARGNIATAGAFLDRAILQGVGGAGGADALLINSGSIDLAALALAESDTGSAFAVATAAGLVQAATAISSSFSGTSAGGTGTARFTFDPIGPASLQLENQGSLSVAVQAEADGGSSAQAQAIVAGASQSANGLTMDVSFANSGSLEVAASANAAASGLADAGAQAVGILQGAAGIAQVTTVFFTQFGSASSVSSTSVVGDALVRLDNSGSLSVAALAQAASGSFAVAGALATGISQAATGTAALAMLDNSGAIAVQAQGRATGTNAFATGSALGVNQVAVGLDEALATVSNSGKLMVFADIEANSERRASGLGSAIGVLQVPEAAGGSAAVVNEGTLAAVARVQAAGSTHVDGQAFAAGVQQIPFQGEFTASLENSGTLNVVAEVIGEVDDGGSAFAFANAMGYQASGHSILADIANSGTISVLANINAVADAGSARANAVGLDVIAFADSGIAGNLEGSIANSGTLVVGARVAGAGTSAGGTSAQSQAFATGIRLASGSIDATVTNSGSIMVEAVAASGGNASAVGILAKDSGVAGGGSALLTFNSSGHLVARQSTDGGSTWHRGTAIDVSAAPDPSVVNLLGGGAIYGNIALKVGDEVNVLGGQTYFNGTIGPSFASTGGIAAAELDSGLFGTGSLTIGNGGNLIFADPRFSGPANMYDGPSYAFVESIDVAAGGTVTIELQPGSAGAQPAGSYSQLFADVANLDGSLAISLTTPNGLFRDSYSWDNLIDANVRNGTFDQCLLAGPLAGSVLLNVNCTYDANSNVDVSVGRAAFNSVAGLNRNGSAVGSALEASYDASSTTPFVAPLTALFRINDAASYNVALNQLSGSAYANYLQSFPSLGIRYNDLLDRGSDCEDQLLGGPETLCRLPSSIHAWGQFDFERREAGGDVEAGTIRSRRATGVLGIDTRLSDNWILGASAGYVTNHLRDHQFGDTVDGDGALVGGYAIYDPGPFYLKAIASYSWFDGDSRRRIDFNPLAPAAGFSARPEGDPNVGLFAAGLHGGARVPIGANALLEPYLNLDFVNAKLRAFDEAGTSGAELSIRDSRSKHTMLTSGLRWAMEVGSVLPEANIGYRHRFDERRATVRTALFGVTGSEFDVLSAAQPRGSVLAGFGVGGRLGNVNLRISYDGEFSRDVSSHSGKLKLVLPLGGS